MKKVFVSVLAIVIILSCDFCTASAERNTNYEHDRSAVRVYGPRKTAYNIVIEALSSKQGRVRANAIEVVADGKQVGLMAEVVKRLDDTVMPVQFAAAMAVGDTKYRPATDKIKSMLNSTDKNVAMAAAYAMVKMGKTENIQIIVTGLKDSDETVEANAAFMAGKLGYRPAIPLLEAIKDNPDSSDTAAFNATEALARLGDEKIYEKIWTMLISVYADDRFMGVNAMAALKTSKAVGAIYTMLDDEIAEVRLTAAEKLGSLGEKGGEAVVLKHLDGEPGPETDKTVIERQNAMAAMAIGTIGTERLAKYLPGLLKSESQMVQLAAAKAVFLMEKP